MKTLLKFVKDESGATAIEYGLIAAGISVAIIAVLQGLGPYQRSERAHISVSSSTSHARLRSSPESFRFKIPSAACAERQFGARCVTVVANRTAISRA
jgi:pilus assembly protein Flp/PilA